MSCHAIWYHTLSHYTCDVSNDCHIVAVASGDFAKGASVSSIHAFSDVGIEQPSKPNIEVSGTHDGCSQIAILATSSCVLSDKKRLAIFYNDNLFHYKAVSSSEDALV